MTNLTAVDSFDETIRVPNEGEEVVAVTEGPGKGPVRPGFQANVNRGAALHALSMNESLVPRFCLRATGADDKVRLHIPGRIAGIDSNGKRWMLTGVPGFLIDPTSQGGGATTWPASSVVYVYGYALTTGGHGLETSTTAPDAGLIFKSTDPTRRYFGCFFTNGATPPLLIEISGERGTYRYVTPRVTAVTGLDGAYAAVSLVGFIPPHARRVLMTCAAVGDTNVNGSQDVYLRPGGGTAEVIAATSPRAVAGSSTVRGTVDLPLLDGTLQYKVGGSSVQAAGLYVAGWTE